VFSSLATLVEGARCLDLFAGTGAMGIEALSRGAASCTFVDSSAAAVRVINENLRRTKLDGTVLRAEAARFLARDQGAFDLVFLDPPYDIPAAALSEILAALPSHLDGDARFVLTRSARGSTDVVPVDFLIERRLSYGDTLVLVCREDR
jgi:16S rRNA (guanine966-N2)-methyltransferase